MDHDDYLFASSQYQDEHDELDSLPSSIDSSDYASSDDGESDAQKEWEANLQQLEMMLTMVIVPWVGKYFGRKFAYWSRLSCFMLSYIFFSCFAIGFCGRDEGRDLL